MMTALLLAFTLQAHAATDDRLKITEISGPRSAKVIRAAGAREQFVEAGELLMVGDEVFTAKGQVISLLAFDGSQWKLAPDSQLKVEARKLEKEKFYHWVFRILKGAMWGQVTKKDEAKDTYRQKIHTPFASLGIRGTEFLIEGDKKSSGMDVLEGTVWFGKNTDFKPGTYREVSAGQHAEIGTDGKIRVTPSKGDKGALAVHYRLAAAPTAPGEAPKKSHSSPEECRADGKGWKSDDGSKVGHCVEISE